MSSSEDFSLKKERKHKLSFSYLFKSLKEKWSDNGGVFYLDVLAYVIIITLQLYLDQCRTLGSSQNVGRQEAEPGPGQPGQSSGGDLEDRGVGV